MFLTIKKIKKNPEKIIFGLQKKGLLDWLGDEAYIKLVYRIAFRKKLNLENPVTFTEKINWYKLRWRNQLAKQCVDKYNVREYVAGKLGPEFLIDCYGCWNSFGEIDFSELPDQFILKPTNGSGDTVICKDRKTFDFNKAEKTLSKNHKRHFSSVTKEWAYYDLPYRILAERLIISKDKTAIRDYKFFCFNGKPQFVLVATDRDTDVKFTLFDLNWNLLPVTCGHDNNRNIQKPEHFDEMLRAAEKLSEDFPHVRVDLYDEEGRIYFGELTFYHYGGIEKFEPDEWDITFGKYFELNRIPKNQLV